MNLTGTRSKARVARGLQFSQSIHHVLGAEAVGVWSFDEGSGTTAYDASGYNNHGTLVNGPVWRCDDVDPNYTPSGAGCSLQFDGVDDYVKFNNAMPFGIDPFTINLWLNSKGVTTAREYIISRRNHYTCLYYWSFHVHGISDSIYNLGFEINTYPDGYKIVNIPFSLSRNAWNHFVGVRDGNNFKGYVNGIKIYELSHPAWGGDFTEVGAKITNIVTLGGWSYPYGVFEGKFTGFIDEVRIYNQALSQAEIQKLYVEGIKRHGIALNKKIITFIYQ